MCDRAETHMLFTCDIVVSPKHLQGDTTPVEPEEEEEEAVPMATDQRVHTDTSTSGRHAHGGRDRGHHQQDGWNVHQDGRHQQHQQASQRWRGERGSGCRDITAYVL